MLLFSGWGDLAAHDNSSNSGRDGRFSFAEFYPRSISYGGRPIDPAEGTPEQPTYPTLTVKMTAYNALPGQTDSTPDRTSIGAYTNPDIIAARSKDLADELPYGTVIEVVPVSTSTKADVNCGRDVVHEQIGLRVIGDAMNPRITNTVDILLDHKELVKVGKIKRNPAKAFGMCKNVTIKIVGRIDTKKMPKTQDELKLALETRNIAVDENLAVSK
jgi:3D (Asp-Asp-Asp) domain-containing protein